MVTKPGYECIIDTNLTAKYQNYSNLNLMLSLHNNITLITIAQTVNEKAVSVRTAPLESEIYCRPSIGIFE